MAFIWLLLGWMFFIQGGVRLSRFCFKNGCFIIISMGNTHAGWVGTVRWKTEQTLSGGWLGPPPWILKLYGRSDKYA